MGAVDDILATVRAEIQAAMAQCRDPDAVAEHVVTAVRQQWAGEQVYIRKSGGRRAEALRLLSQGKTPEGVAAMLGVHASTVYRWRQARRESTGLGSRDWVL